MSTRVWGVKVDCLLDAYVEQTAEGHGILKIDLDGKNLHSKPVTIALTTAFGLDEADVDDWENESLRFLEEYKANNPSV